MLAFESLSASLNDNGSCKNRSLGLLGQRLTDLRINSRTEQQFNRIRGQSTAASSDGEIKCVLMDRWEGQIKVWTDACAETNMHTFILEIYICFFESDNFL